LREGFRLPVNAVNRFGRREATPRTRTAETASVWNSGRDSSPSE